MSDILIRGMKMPAHDRVLIVFPSGRVLEVAADKTQYIYSETKAVSVPQHGRLVDALYIRDGIVQKWMDKADDSRMYKFGMQDAYEVIRNAPTIIPASE